MAAKMGLVVKLAVVALLLAAVSANARSLDLFDLLASKNPDHFQLVKHKKLGQACCDMCVCTRRNEPQCTCWDVFIGNERCEDCDACVCTRSLPPKCTCKDVRIRCPPKCSSASTTAGSAEAAEATTIGLEIVTSAN